VTRNGQWRLGMEQRLELDQQCKYEQNNNGKRTIVSE
jgi:hypothetical protein